MKTLSLATAVLLLLGLGIVAQAAITIDTVRVGDAANAADTRVMNDGTTGYGSVAYAYNIGKYEVTAGQYTAFLNAEAKTDPYRLYSTSMANTAYGCGITQSGVSGSYSYSVASGFANRPVNFVCFWDAARFVNWLGNGQGDGDTENGAYTLNGYKGIEDGTIHRNSTWTWAVASEDEWYKAAYYKGGGTNAGYWLYPTKSDQAPGRDMADPSGNNANITGTPYPIDWGKYFTNVGEFQNSPGPYGTFDQGGNVWEWNDRVVIDAQGIDRGLRGGSCYDSADSLNATYRYSYPTSEHYNWGFRVSQFVPVPEPSSLVALAGGLVSFLSLMRRRT